MIIARGGEEEGKEAEKVYAAYPVFPIILPPPPASLLLHYNRHFYYQPYQ